MAPPAAGHVWVHVAVWCTRDRQRAQRRFRRQVVGVPRAIAGSHNGEPPVRARLGTRRALFGTPLCAHLLFLCASRPHLAPDASRLAPPAAAARAALRAAKSGDRASLWLRQSQHRARVGGGVEDCHHLLCLRRRWRGSTGGRGAADCPEALLRFGERRQGAPVGGGGRGLPQCAVAATTATARSTSWGVGCRSPPLAAAVGGAAARCCRLGVADGSWRYGGALYVLDGISATWD